MADFNNLDGEKHVRLTTFRRSGEEVATAMWFVLKDGHMYMRTSTTSGKMKRMRATPRAIVASSTATGKPTGRAIQTRVTLLPESDLDWINAAILKKYGIMKRLVDFYNRFAVKGGISAIELTAE